MGSLEIPNAGPENIDEVGVEFVDILNIISDSDSQDWEEVNKEDDPDYQENEESSCLLDAMIDKQNQGTQRFKDSQ